MKFRRQTQIIQLIENYDIETQEELTEMLIKSGFDTTQATVSRDIKELRLVKISLQSGNSKYAIATDSDTTFTTRLQNIFKECVLSIEVAQNIVVIKTLGGLGSAAGAAIDSLKHEDLVGTLAGDDTVFVAIKDVHSAEIFANDTRKMLK